MGIFDKFKKNKSKEQNTGINTPEIRTNSESKTTSEINPDDCRKFEIKPENVGKFNDLINYFFLYRPEYDVYFVEIRDRSGVYLADPATIPFYMTGYASFALTQDEYNLKVVHNDIEISNELIGKLLKNLPEDRFIGCGCVVESTGERSDLKLVLKCETMDDFAYQKYLNKRAIPYIRSLNTVYVVFMRSTGEKIPSVDNGGYAWVYSEKEYADNTIQQNTGVDLFYKEFNKDEFEAFVKTWYRYGIARFKFNPGTNDRFALIDRDDYLPIEGIKKWDIVGSNLNQLIIRFFQDDSIKNNPTSHANAMTMWSYICHELYRSVFLVPFTYGDEPFDVEDWVIHTSLASGERLSQMEIERLLGNKIEESRNIVFDNQNGKKVYCLNKNMIYGSEKYHFAEEGEVAPGRSMNLRTIFNGKNTLLCAFTDFESLHAIFGENVRVAVQTYEEIICRLNSETENGPIIGLVINPGTNELFLSRENIEYAEKEKNEPIKHYSAEDSKNN